MSCSARHHPLWPSDACTRCLLDAERARCEEADALLRECVEQCGMPIALANRIDAHFAKYPVAT